MRIKIIHIIAFLIVYVPFENILLKYLPVSDYVYSISRMIPEAFIYVLLLYVIGTKVLNRNSFNKNPIHIPIIVFISYSILLVIINSAPLLSSLVGLRAVLRYIALFYVIINLNIKYSTVVKLVNVLFLIAVFQSILTIYHHYFGISEFWMPRANTLEISGRVSNFKILKSTALRSGREIGVGIGTFGDSVYLATFLVICCALILPYCFKRFRIGTKFNQTIILAYILLMVGLLFSYSRGGVIIGFILLPLTWIFVSNVKRVVLISVIVITLCIPFLVLIGDSALQKESAFINPTMKYVNPIENITHVFSSDYRKSTFEHSRGYTIAVVGFDLVQSVTIFGFSPASQFALDKAIGRNLRYVHFNNLFVINDVYWIAFIIYYGFIGLAIFWYILYKLFRVSYFVYKNSNKVYYKALGLSMSLIIVTAIPYAFIIRTFVFRQYSFYFWVLAALVVVEWQRLSIQKSKSSVITNSTNVS